MTLLCCVSDCAQRAKARGLCLKHYHRQRRHGDPLKFGGKSLRFVRDVLVPTQDDQCIPWPFARNAHGYGTIKVDKRSQIASRYICEIVNGPPPDQSFDAAHLCGNGHNACVNPKHLTWKTRRENNADMDIHGTRARGERASKVKLKEADVRFIRRAIRTSTPKRLAEKFGVSPITIRSIRDRRTWAWL